MTELSRRMCVAGIVGGSQLAWGLAPRPALAEIKSAEQARFIAWARGAAVPPDDAHLIELVGDARVIALGEFMHGGHEPLALRNRLVRALAERGMIDAVVLESGLIEGRRLNAFVMGGEGDAVAVAREYLNWGFGRFAENVDLLRWLRQFNARPQVRKVALHGMDIPGGDDLAVGNISLAVRDVIAFIQRVPSTKGDALVMELHPYGANLNQSNWFELPSVAQGRLMQAVASVPAFLEDARAQYLPASSVDEFDWALRSAIVLNQVVELFHVWPADNKEGSSPKGLYPSVQVRDAAMAENFLWLLNRQGPKARMLVFAATGHIERSRDQNPQPIFPGPFTSMGEHLTARLGNSMRVILTGARCFPPFVGRGRNAPHSFGASLEQVSPRAFLLDIRRAPAGLDADVPQSMGDNVVSITAKPRTTFDAIIFFPEVTVEKKTNS